MHILVCATTVGIQNKIQVADPANIFTAMKLQTSVPVPIKNSAVFKDIRRFKIIKSVIVADAYKCKKILLLKTSSV